MYHPASPRRMDEAEAVRRRREAALTALAEEEPLGTLAGRLPVTAEGIRDLLHRGYSPVQVARALRISKATLYRRLKEG